MEVNTNWKKYIGEVVSFLIIGKEDKTENYIGIIEDITEDEFMILDTNNPDFTIGKIIFKTNLIKSVWVYKKTKK
mgnify:CR=1 FL=1